MTDPNQTPETAPTQTEPAAEELKKQVAELQEQVKEKENKYLYLYAEFDNFRKRTIRERSEQIKFGCEPLARDILQVVDNLERALAHVPPETDKNLSDGLKMVLNQFRGILEKQGIQRLETVQKEFDPNLHEAVAQSPSEHPAGLVIEEHGTGYTLHGRLLRPARVVVSGGKPQEKTPEKKASGS